MSIWWLVKAAGSLRIRSVLEIKVGRKAWTFFSISLYGTMLKFGLVEGFVSSASII
jgi:hypothetical protein